jgi:hypothetical protein
VPKRVLIAPQAIPLRATRHHLYYLTGKDAVIVLAVWGSLKGSGPNLEGIE